MKQQEQYIETIKSYYVASLRKLSEVTEANQDAIDLMRQVSYREGQLTGAMMAAGYGGMATCREIEAIKRSVENE